MLSKGTQFSVQVSSEYRVAASAYRRRHNRRFIVTTSAAITRVADSSSRKLPLSVAELITAPSPTVERTLPLKWKYSATMLAFHAPPDAVTNPVIRYGKTAGSISFRHRSTAPKRKISHTSFRSDGIADAPAITLKRMYHCVPSSSRAMDHRVYIFGWYSAESESPKRF